MVGTMVAVFMIIKRHAKDDSTKPPILDWISKVKKKSGIIINK